MDGQQIIATTIVIAAAVWLGRQFLGATRNFFSSKGACGGCDNCAAGAAAKKAGTASRSNVIALSDIGTLPPHTPIDDYLKR